MAANPCLSAVTGARPGHLFLSFIFVRTLTIAARGLTDSGPQTSRLKRHDWDKPGGKRFESGVLGPFVLGPFVLGPFVLGPFVLGSEANPHWAASLRATQQPLPGSQRPQVCYDPRHECE